MSDTVIVEPFLTVEQVHDLLRRNSNIKKQEIILREWATSIINNCKDQVAFEPYDTEVSIELLKEKL